MLGTPRWIGQGTPHASRRKNNFQKNFLDSSKLFADKLSMTRNRKLILGVGMIYMMPHSLTSQRHSKKKKRNRMQNEETLHFRYKIIGQSLAQQFRLEHFSFPRHWSSRRQFSPSLAQGTQSSHAHTPFPSRHRFLAVFIFTYEVATALSIESSSRPHSTQFPRCISWFHRSGEPRCRFLQCQRTVPCN